MSDKPDNTYVIHDKYGAIQMVLQTDESCLQANLSAGQSYIIYEGVIDWETMYVDTEAKAPASKIELVPDGWPEQGEVGQMIHFAEIPVGTRVIWPDGYVSVETDGELSFETDMAGDYKFVFKSPKHLALEWTVDVAPEPE